MSDFAIAQSKGSRKGCGHGIGGLLGGHMTAGAYCIAHVEFRLHRRQEAARRDLSTRGKKQAARRSVRSHRFMSIYGDRAAHNSSIFTVQIRCQ